MHYSRIVAIVGVVVGVVGFFIKKANSAGEAALAQLSQAPDSPFPESLDENTWSALFNDTAWAAAVYAVAAAAVLVAAVFPPVREAMKRLVALAVTVLGVLMLVVGVFATLGAADDADTLQAGFAGAFAQGAIPEAYTVTIGWGWFLLIIGGVIAAIGGVLSLIARPDENALEDV